MGYNHQYTFIFKTCIFVGLMLTACQIKSQSIIRQSLSSLGGSYSTNGITVQSVTGQSSSTINTIQKNGTLRQGFIQPPSTSKVIARPLPSVLIYPNPSTGLFHIKMEFEPGDRFEVSTILGAKLLTKEITSTTKEQDFDLEGKSEGVYLITILRQNQIIKTTKLVLAK